MDLSHRAVILQMQGAINIGSFGRAPKRDALQQ